MNTNDSVFNYERDLIEEYDKISKEIIQLQYVKNSLHDSFNENDEKSLYEKTEKKSQLTQELKTLANRPLSLKKLCALISQFDAIISKLIENRDGLSISGNQGLIFETAIYSFIIEDIEFALSMEGHMWSIPFYYHEKDSKFNYGPVKELLQKYFDELKKIYSPDYVLLESIVIRCTNELQEMARGDYKRICSSQLIAKL